MTSKKNTRTKQPTPHEVDEMRTEIFFLRQDAALDRKELGMLRLFFSDAESAFRRMAQPGTKAEDVMLILLDLQYKMTPVKLWSRV